MLKGLEEYIQSNKEDIIVTGGITEEEVALDVSNIKTAEEFHQYLKLKLEFPEFYGMNWDAFWDAITGLVELPENIVIIGWNELVKLIPEEANSFIEIMELYNKEYPMWKCSIRYI